MIDINLVYEDDVSHHLMRKLLAYFDNKFNVVNTYSGNGFGYIKKGIGGFNAASEFTPFFVLTDLDRHECPVIMMNDWLPAEKHRNLIFRVAVREVESWLLSDREGFFSFLKISKDLIPRNPDTENDPKQTLFNLVRKSRRREIKEDILPRNEYAKQGPNYNDRLQEFISNDWVLKRAIRHSESLNRAYRHLESFQL
ncbi:MAG: hypothetical protein ACK4GN_16030 [Runella sp.]